MDYANIITGLEQAEVFSSTDTVSKDKVLSVRIEPGLYSLLEALTESWKTKNVSDTLRTILSMFFLPVVYEHEYKNLVPEKLETWKAEEQETGFSFQLARLEKFVEELSEYMDFLNEAEERGALSIGFIGAKKEQVQEAINKLAGMQQDLKEFLLEGKNKKMK
jgi:hypothetical protein